MTQLRTSLTRHAGAMRDPDPAGPDRFAREAWHRHGSVVITADRLRQLDWRDRELLTSIATKEYGPRGPQ